ncbi:MAG: ribonuclease D [Myxococcota bacterium]
MHPAPAHTWIASPNALAPLEAALMSATEVALDTESNSMFAYRERLCLVQLATLAPGREPELFLVDPLAFATASEALAPLAGWLADPAHRVLIHGGEYDVAIMKRELGFGPTNLFDTQAAAALIGIEKTGFGALVEAFCGVTLPKSHQQHDWKRRPVPADALAYAVADVHYLVPLAKAIEAIVKDADIEEEVALACLAVAEARAHAPRDPDQAFWRVLGGARPGAEAMSMLVALVAWREAVAEARDVPPARLVPNESLLRVAERAPSSASDLGGLGLPKDIVRQPEALLAAIEKARAEPPPSPARPPRPRVDPAIAAREKRLKQWREDEARQRGAPLQLVLPARALDHLATLGEAGLESAPQLGPKRLARYGDALRRLLR